MWYQSDGKNNAPRRLLFHGEAHNEFSRSRRAFGEKACSELQRFALTNSLTGPAASGTRPG